MDRFTSSILLYCRFNAIPVDGTNYINNLLKRNSKKKKFESTGINCPNQYYFPVYKRKLFRIYDFTIFSISYSMSQITVVSIMHHNTSIYLCLRKE